MAGLAPGGSRTDAETLVRLSVRSGVATLTLDSPSNRNALSRGLVAQLDGHLRRVTSDDAVRVVVLTHTGPVFCSGADLREARQAPPTDQPVTTLPDVLVALWRSPVPVVCRVGGAVRAGGLGLVAACDVALAARSATFAFTEVRLGLVPAVVSVVCLPRLRPRDAAEMLLGAEPVDAERAAGAGLVTRAVADEELDGEVEAVTASLRRGSPSALAATKRLLSGPDDHLVRDLAVMSRLSADRFASEEGQEGLRSFAERRPPRWAV